jgi:hypothetical protein
MFRWSYVMARIYWTEQGNGNQRPIIIFITVFFFGRTVMKHRMQHEMLKALLYKTEFIF